MELAGERWFNSRIMGRRLVFLLMLAAAWLPLVAAEDPLPSGAVLCLKAEGVELRREGEREYVTGWKNSTGKGLEVSQKDVQWQPQYAGSAINGLPALRFSRSRRDHLNNSASNLLPSGSPRTVLIVAQSDSVGGTLLTFRRSTAGATSVFTLQQLPLGSQHYVYSDGASDRNGTVLAPEAATIGKPFLAVYRSEGPDLQLHADLNGHKLAVSGGHVSAETGLAGFTIGNREDEGAKWGQGWDGLIAEVIVYDRALSDDEVEAASLPLSNKYNIPIAYKQLPLPAVAAVQVDFKRHVYPILQKRCFSCHEGRDAESGVRLDLREEILGETTGLIAASSGRSGKSRLIHLVAGVAEDGKRMPPKGKRLTDEEVGLLRAWIDQGLVWDDKLLPPLATTSDHWAFQPPLRSSVPAVRITSWPRTAVDHFVGAAHESRELMPAQEADRRTLIRRLSFDLLGLPPTAQEVDAFVNDTLPAAYERLVERLLSSPHYGERWGRHWLDVVRWADTEGYEMNYPRPYAWRYRDYVVKAFNDDKPFDQFIRQQVAGDELAPYSDENLIATGFLASARYSCNEDDLQRQRMDVQFDITANTASALLGLTLGCAQCHNHKFDPITQRDYYRFQSFFANGQLLNLMLKDQQLWKQHAAEMAANLKPDKPQTFGFYSPLSPIKVEAEPLKAVFQLPYRPEELKRERARMLIRGDIKNPGPPVSAAWPAVLGAGPSEQETRERPKTALANWLTSPKNPLLARVWVNRIWQYHFGRGIVASSADFGVKCSPPTHGELLDWLATELVRSGWSTKHIHRLIVLSSTYRQSSRGHAENHKIDPDNNYWWRWQPRRLEAELVRDSMLRVSGELDAKMGGPSVPRNMDASTPRRAMYLFQDRNDYPDMQRFFDGPAATESCSRRATTTVPLQPLYLLNNAYVVDRAKALAGRVFDEAGNDARRQAILTFRLALQREPDEQELGAAIAFLTKAAQAKPSTRPAGADIPARLVHFAHAMLNLNEFFYIP